MPRDVDEKKTRKALRKLRKAKTRAETDGIELTDWEKDFVDGVDQRLTKYGSAFADPSLGAPDEALSRAQTQILRHLDRKSRGKATGGLQTRKPLKARKDAARPGPRVRQIDDDVSESADTGTEPDVPYTENLPKLQLIRPAGTESPQTSSKAVRTPSEKPAFRVIEGGKSNV